MSLQPRLRSVWTTGRVRRSPISSFLRSGAQTTPQRPKAETYLVDGQHDHLLCIFRIPSLDAEDELRIEQIGVVLGAHCVITFQEGHEDFLTPIRSRLETPRRPIRSSGSDYLAYAILDAVVDGYYPILERIAERLEAAEERIMESPTPKALQRLQRLKRALLLLRRAVSPQREALAQLLRELSTLIEEDTKIFLRDVYDHSVQVADVIESYRDLVGELTNTHLSVVSNRMNEVMKVLTIMASIFIPLTFMAGIYGMNFESMPELGVRWAYPVLLGSMVVVAGLMVLYFYSKGWIGFGSKEDD